MMLPPPARRRRGIACLVHRNTPLRLTEMVRFHSSSVSSWVGLLTPAIPALLTRMSRWPNVPTTSAKTL